MISSKILKTLRPFSIVLLSLGDSPLFLSWNIGWNWPNTQLWSCFPQCQWHAKHQHSHWFNATGVKASEALLFLKDGSRSLPSGRSEDSLVIKWNIFTSWASAATVSTQRNIILTPNKTLWFLLMCAYKTVRRNVWQQVCLCWSSLLRPSDQCSNHLSCKASLCCPNTTNKPQTRSVNKIGYNRFSSGWAWRTAVKDWALSQSAAR